MQKELMYNINSIVVSLVLLAIILLANELGFRLGRRFQKNSDQEVKSQTNSIQAGILGLLALLLGFTFNMSLQRFDNRSMAQIDEANAIGTAMLRTKLLPAPYNTETHSLFQEYVDLRIKTSKIDLTKESERKQINKETDDLQSKIWEKALAASDIDSRPITTGMFISSLNEVIDAQGKRNAILQQHIPEVILFLLFAVFIISGALMGYSSGLGMKRTFVPSFLMTTLIVLVVFIIIDLDRPKRGIIQVKQDSMMSLKSN